MPLVKLPDGSGEVFVLGPPEEVARSQALIYARHAFVVQYCKEKGWPEKAEALSIEQILEIRNQSGWKEPKLDE